MRTLKFLLLLIVFITAGSAYAQDTKELKEEAAYYYDNKDFKKAYELYDKLYTQNPKNMEYKYRLGVSSINYPDKKERAVGIFEDLKKIDKSPEIDYYLAKAYHINYRFDEALVAYNEYLALKQSGKIKEDDKLLMDDATLGIANCNNGKDLINQKIVADIKNVGLPINTPELEGVPIISADESIMIFTYVGKKSTGGLLNDELKPDATSGSYHEDIFISTRVNDSTWSEPTGIAGLNTKANDAAVALSPDGQILFSFTSNNDAGDLFMSSLTGTEWSKPVRLNKNINTPEWEGSCSISSDERFLYFASERPGGIGGRDLYVSEKINGDWGPAQNLGPNINTAYNEDAPFIHPDGITLFFSSEGHKSIGGYDIMYSIKQENNWIEPLSMGIPLNTTEDDRFYVINAKGDKGYFSSNRAGAGGKGGQDIYTVEPGILGEKPILALLKGNVFADDKPIEAKIEVNKKVTNESIGPYYANAKTGKYLMALSPGNGYKIRISVSVPGFEPIEEEIDVEKLQKFVEIKKDFYVYSANYANKKSQKSVKSILDSLLGNVTNVEDFKNDAAINNIIDANVPTTIPDTIKPNLTPCNSGSIPDFTVLKGKSLNIPENYKKLLSIGGLTCAEGLAFKVQIAAYRHPENYKYDNLKEFGAPEIINYPDGITRFTQMNFSTLNEAEALRQKIIAKGQKDAWVTAFINGKRYTLEELILVNFMAKAVN